MRNANGNRTAFTLVELLVVVGSLAALFGILMPALSQARKSANEVRSLSNLRQMLLGYTLYQQENKGALLFGHTPPTINGSPVSVQDPVSGQIFGYPVSDRYPWRLVGEVSDVWSIIHSHDALPPLPQEGESASAAFLKAYTLSLNPTYGINSVYVGGDASFNGFIGDKPNGGKHVVFKAAEVQRASDLIVFADCQAANVPSLKGQGYHTLMPPRAHGLKWTVDVGNEVIKPNTAEIMGIPTGWYTKHVMTGFFDGHAEAMMPDQLNDMRLWANQANTPDYDYTP